MNLDDIEAWFASHVGKCLKVCRQTAWGGTTCDTFPVSSATTRRQSCRMNGNDYIAITTDRVVYVYEQADCNAVISEKGLAITGMSNGHGQFIDTYRIFPSEVAEIGR